MKVNIVESEVRMNKTETFNRLSNIASEYMKLKTRNEEIQKTLRKENELVPVSMTTVLAEQSMKALLDKQGTVDINGLTPQLRTHSQACDDIKVMIPSTSTLSSQNDVHIIIREGKEIGRNLRTWRRNIRKQIVAPTSAVEQTDGQRTDITGIELQPITATSDVNNTQGSTLKATDSPETTTESKVVEQREVEELPPRQKVVSTTHEIDVNTDSGVTLPDLENTEVDHQNSGTITENAKINQSASEKEYHYPQAQEMYSRGRVIETTSESKHSQNAASEQGSLAGLRVVRGPDWSFGGEDGGEGTVGTVKPAIYKEGFVTVVWDTGKSGEYQIEGKHELLVLDPGPAGICHDKYCYECTNDLKGFRWQCIDCVDYNICSDCYGSERHDMGHKFQRFNFGQSSEIVGSRNADEQKITKGLFRAARVFKNRDSNWIGDLDAHGIIDGSVYANDGRHLVIVKFKEKTGEVLYKCFVGWRGKVDVFASKPAQGYKYYKNQLPKLTCDLQRDWLDWLRQKTQQAMGILNQVGVAVQQHLGGIEVKLPGFSLTASIVPDTAEKIKTRELFKPGDIVKLQQNYISRNNWINQHYGFVIDINMNGMVDVCYGAYVAGMQPAALIRQEFKPRNTRQVYLSAWNHILVGDLVWCIDSEHRMGSMIGGSIGMVLNIDEKRNVNVTTLGKIEGRPTLFSSLIPQHICFPDIENDLTKATEAPGLIDGWHIGDVVRVLDDLKLVRGLQDRKHGGWNSEMKEFLGECGILIDTPSPYQVVLSFGEKRFVFNIRAVNLLSMKNMTMKPRDNERIICVGDLVCTSDDSLAIEKLQNHHGGWRNSMNRIVGKVGVVAETFDEDSDNVLVCFGDYTYKLHTSILKDVIVNPKTSMKGTNASTPRVSQDVIANPVIRNQKEYSNADNQNENEILERMKKILLEITGKRKLQESENNYPSPYNPD